MKYMAYLTGESVDKIEEVVIFGNTLRGLRESEEYKDFLSDGYKEETVFSLEVISGHSCLPPYICKD